MMEKESTSKREEHVWEMHFIRDHYSFLSIFLHTFTPEAQIGLFLLGVLLHANLLLTVITVKDISMQFVAYIVAALIEALVLINLPKSIRYKLFPHSSFDPLDMKRNQYLINLLFFVHGMIDRKIDDQFNVLDKFDLLHISGSLTFLFAFLLFVRTFPPIYIFHVLSLMLFFMSIFFGRRIHSEKEEEELERFFPI